MERGRVVDQGPYAQLEKPGSRLAPQWRRSDHGCHLILRTEAASNNVTDYGVNKAFDHLLTLRDKLC